MPTQPYKNEAGKRVPGVTTVIGRFKDSGGLMFWAFEQGKAAERGEIERLYDQRDEAGSLGTVVHEMVEAHIDQADYMMPSDLTGEQTTKVWEAYGAYFEWQKNCGMEFVAQEIPLVSEQYQYGGCPDAIAMINGKLCLIDWKTSNAVYPDYMIQLAAYKHLWEENGNDPIEGFHLCRFSKDYGDFAHHYYPELDDAWEQFKLFRQSYEIDKRLKKRAK